MHNEIFSKSVQHNDDEFTAVEVYRTFNNEKEAYTYAVDVYGSVDFYGEYDHKATAVQVAQAYVNGAKRKNNQTISNEVTQ